MDKSILVVGAGAIGGISAAILKNQGYDVEIVCKHEDYRDLIMDKGLSIRGVKGKLSERMKAYASLSDINGKKDIILFAIKATDIELAIKDLHPLLKRDSLLISMQNGICEPELGRLLGRQYIVGCIVGWGATMIQAGELEMTSEGDFVIGYLDGEEDERLGMISEMLSSIMPVRTTDSIMGHLYSKLIINSCITSLGAITGLSLGEMMRRRKIRKLFIQIIREAVELADILKLRIEKYADRLDYYEFVSDKRRFPEMRRHIILRLMGMKYRRLKSSSLQSLQRGKLTEIDYLNGYISSNGREYGVPSPVNSAVVSMIHEIEEGKRKISPYNLEEEVFEKYY